MSCGSNTDIGENTDLTLTRVVFELEMDEEVIKKAEHLTLTRVVFECSYF